LVIPYKVEDSMKTLALAVLTMGMFALGQQERLKEEIKEVPAGERPEFTSEPGWELISPQEFRGGRKWGFAKEDGLIVSGYSVVDADGVLRIYCVRTSPGGLEVNDPEYRVVVFDAAGKRYLPERDQAGGMGTQATHVSTAVFSLDPQTLAPGQVAYIAVEQAEPGPQLDQPAQDDRDQP
jgi:hypothetical protein